jgi:hypothetical protein
MTTRRELLAATAATAVATASPARAAVTNGTDEAIVKLLVAFAHEVVVAYRQALGAASLRPGDRVTLTRLAAQASEMEAALQRVGGGSAPVSPSPRPSSARTRDDHLRAVVQQEETLTTAWYRALQRLAERNLIEGAVAYMAAGGRRLVVLRELAGLPLLPRAFETGGL